MKVRVASVGYAVPQGLGWLHRWFFDAGVITDPIVFKHTSPQRVTNMSWFPSGTPLLTGRPFVGPAVDDVLDRVQIMLFFETPFDWTFVDRCRERGVKTVLMPMYEWTPRRWPAKPDWIMAPSLLDLDYFRDEFPGRAEYLPVPVDPTMWRLRTTANRFLHNAGNVGHREHKGTRQFVEAIPLVKSPEARFILRAQDTTALCSILNDHPKARDDSRLTVDTSDRLWQSLWEDADVYVAPEKFNGLTLPPVEAYAAGMPVITTDRYPLNTVLPNGGLMIKPASLHRAAISSNYREFDECVVTPESIAAKIDEWYGKDVTQLSLAARDWGKENSWTALKPRYDEFMLRVVSCSVGGLRC